MIIRDLSMKKLILIILLFLSAAVPGQTERIYIDEDFNDWANVNIAHNDKSQDNGQGDIDFSTLKIFNDENYIYIMIDCGYEFNLNDNNNLALYIDTDLNESTGIKFNGIGAELKYIFGNKEGEVLISGFDTVINHSAIGLTCAPTVSSQKFEIAINRYSEISGQNLFPNNTVKICFADGESGDLIPDNGGVEYSFTSGQLIEMPEYSIEKSPETDLRILTYNIENDAFVENDKKEYFSRIINALDADIIAFQEFKDSSGSKVETVLEEMTNLSWFVKKIGYDLVLASKFQITDYDSIETYQGSTFTKIHSVYKLDLRPKYESDLILFNMHPKCCSGSSNDLKREQEFDMVMAYFRDSRDNKTNINITNETPVCFLGDMNLVGSNIQQLTLLTGDIIDNSKYGPDFTPDWNGNDLIDLKPFATGRTMTFTSYQEESSYPPGRLDYIVYTGSVLEAVNSFVLFTPGLSDEELQKHNLQKNDALSASDHLPVVADLKLKKITDVKQLNKLPEKFRLYQNYPNPFNPETKINYEIPENGLVKLKIYDLLGREIETIINNFQEAGNYTRTVDLSSYSSGTYFYSLNVNGFNETRKMIYIK